ncbi:glycosyltransferase family 2 protein [Skermanella stibiiresistens]|uniref:glycosyltransferase family 2 protein n=1 Tax=Skermanella stibiiresistens TaxID=913326 RepID=UPI00068590C6|nr:glycosyltransferase family A protein [Skermanella stibiiresistens]
MISIVMPSYNSAGFIREAIDSITAQTFPHFELLVCDDGSTDDTIAIVEELARVDNRIRLIRNQHGGVSRNCNVGLREARFPWIARLDADDIAAPDRLETQIKAAERHPDVVCWGGGSRMISRDGRKLRRAQLGPVDMAEFDELRRTGKVIYIIGPTVMFKRDAALRVGGYDPRFDGAEDIDLLNRLADLGPTLTLPKILTHYRIHGKSITASRSARQRIMFAFIEERNIARLGGHDLDFDAHLARLAARSTLRRLHEDIAGRGSQYYKNTVIHFAERRLLKALGTGVLAVVLQPVSSSGRVYGWISRGVRRRLNDLTRDGGRGISLTAGEGDRPAG